jgi:NTE family protein
MSDQTRPKVALVIGSGGLKCAAVIGLVEVLEREKIDLDMVIGCSGGAVFGAGLALGFNSDQLNKTRELAWTADVTKKISLSSVMKILFPKAVRNNDLIGIFDDSKMTDNIEQAFGKTTVFADMEIPFHCVATDFHTGEMVVLSEGPLAKAVRISSGIPVIFKPIDWNGQLLIDGGLSNPLPVDVAIQQGANIIIAVGFETPLTPSIASPGQYAMQMFNILVNQLLYKKYAFFNAVHHSEIITIMPEFSEEIRINDVDKVPYIIDQGRKETEKHIAYLRKMLASEEIINS